MDRGFVQVYTGNGKGKTTAALGLALRAAGQGLKVVIIQFMKGYPDSGEFQSVKKLSPYVTIERVGRKTFVSESNPDPIDFKCAQEGLLLTEKAFEEKSYDIVILDEINLAVDYGLVRLSDVLKLIDSKPKTIELILTGRNARAEILEKADLVTEMVKRKHYYESGVPARKGIEI